MHTPSPRQPSGKHKNPAIGARTHLSQRPLGDPEQVRADGCPVLLLLRKTRREALASHRAALKITRWS